MGQSIIDNPVTSATLNDDKQTKTELTQRRSLKRWATQTRTHDSWLIDKCPELLAILPKGWIGSDIYGATSNVNKHTISSTEFYVSDMNGTCTCNCNSK